MMSLPKRFARNRPATRPLSIEMLEPRQLLATVGINISSVLHTLGASTLGTNLAWWQYEMSSSQMETMVRNAGLKLFRMPGGSSSDDNLHFNSSPPYYGYDTVATMAKFIADVGGNAMVTLNYGTGSPQEAAAYLAYLNAQTSDTTVIGNGEQWNTTSNTWVQKNWQTAGYWASLRAATPLGTDDGYNFLRISHSAPFNFTYFDIGNECYATWENDKHGQGGDTGSPQDPTTYVTFAKTFSTLAHLIYPNAKIGLETAAPLRWNMPDANWVSDVLTQCVSEELHPRLLVRPHLHYRV